MGRVPTALAEERSLVFSVHTAARNSRASDAFFWTPQTVVHTCDYTHKHIIKNKKNH